WMNRLLTGFLTQDVIIEPDLARGRAEPDLVVVRAVGADHDRRAVAVVAVGVNPAGAVLVVRHLAGAIEAEDLAVPGGDRGQDAPRVRPAARVVAPDLVRRGAEPDLVAVRAVGADGDRDAIAVGVNPARAVLVVRPLAGAIEAEDPAVPGGDRGQDAPRVRPAARVVAPDLVRCGAEPDLVAVRAVGAAGHRAPITVGVNPAGAVLVVR